MRWHNYPYIILLPSLGSNINMIDSESGLWTIALAERTKRLSRFQIKDFTPKKGKICRRRGDCLTSQRIYGFCLIQSAKGLAACVPPVIDFAARSHVINTCITRGDDFPPFNVDFLMQVQRLRSIVSTARLIYLQSMRKDYLSHDIFVVFILGLWIL